MTLEGLLISHRADSEVGGDTAVEALAQLQRGEVHEQAYLDCVNQASFAGQT